jgi:hypothetical protein
MVEIRVLGLTVLVSKVSIRAIGCQKARVWNMPITVLS